MTRSRCPACAQLQDQLDELRERHRQLKTTMLAGPAIDPSLNLTPQESEILGLLMRRGGLVSNDQIMQMLYGARPGDPPSSNGISVLMHRIRKKVLPLGVAIINIKGQGYQITRGREALLYAGEKPLTMGGDHEAV